MTLLSAEGRSTPPPWSSQSQSRRLSRRPRGRTSGPATPIGASRSTKPARTAIRSTRTTSDRAIAGFGRKAASLPDYDYSDALKSANIVWNEETLDKWLTDPQAVAPGAKMFFHLESAQDRADVIAYLRERAK
jgi:hypothetical protein